MVISDKTPAFSSPSDPSNALPYIVLLLAEMGEKKDFEGEKELSLKLPYGQSARGESGPYPCQEHFPETHFVCWKKLSETG